MYFKVSEDERSNILKMYGVLQEEKTPLQKLLECKVTSDGKYIISEGQAYSTETGEIVPINEAWSTSNILHAGADLLSAGMDFVLPGSGAVVDTLNAISYLIEAQFKSPDERASLYIMAGITFAFVVIPGPLQAIAIPLKNAIKTGKGFASPIVKQGIKIVSNSMDTVLKFVPSIVQKALKSPLAKNILGKWGPKIGLIIETFTKNVKTFFKNFAAKEGAEAVTKTTAKSTLNATSKGILSRFFTKIPKIVNPAKVLKKAGFAEKYSYRYLGPKGMTTVTIKQITDSGVTVVFKKGTKTSVPIETFIKNAIGAPWMRRGYSVAVPFFIKRFSDMVTSNFYNIDAFQDLNPQQASQESLAYMNEELTGYEGETKQYTVNDTVKTFQTALNLLCYQLSKYGIDGKFGPETQAQLTKFQQDSGFSPDVLGKMDRTTASKLSQELKMKNVPNSQITQDYLNKYIQSK